MAGIVHKAIKLHGDKGYAAEWNDDHRITDNVDVEQHQFLNNVVENRTDFPAGPVEGQIIYRSDLNSLQIWTGSDWEVLAKWTDIGILSGPKVWGCPGCNFVPSQPKDFNYEYIPSEGRLRIITTAGDQMILAPVILPSGAIVMKVIVYGSNSGNEWYLYRIKLDGTGFGDEMAAALINAEDITIDDPQINNSSYAYWLEAQVSNGDRIYGARIWYFIEDN